jgi:hypothetical protein
MNQALVSRSGTSLQAGYYPGVSPAASGGRGAQLATQGMRLIAGGEHTPEWTPDERHCQWVAGEAQCMSWPVKNKPNPERYCAGHMKKVAATNGPQPTADQGLRTAAS